MWIRVRHFPNPETPSSTPNITYSALGMHGVGPKHHSSSIPRKTQGDVAGANTGPRREHGLGRRKHDFGRRTCTGRAGSTLAGAPQSATFGGIQNTVAGLDLETTPTSPKENSLDTPACQQSNPATQGIKSPGNHQGITGATTRDFETNAGLRALRLEYVGTGEAVPW